MATSADLPNSPVDLLTQRATYEGWEYWAERRQRYYVVGVFRVLQFAPVQNSMLELYRFWPDARREIESKPGWRATNFDWRSNVAYSQFLRVARSKPLLFDKAAKVAATSIFACNRWANDPGQIDRAKGVRIVPAVFFIE